MTLVVDASMAITWVLEDEPPLLSDDVLRRVAAHGGYVPSLWKLEIANVLRVAVRARRCTESYAADSLRRLGAMNIVVDEETDLHVWGRTYELSREYGLTIYDATYLELALRRASGLATCDKALAKAAQRASVEVILG